MLIHKTITDVKIFSIMLLMVIIAFANVFFILNTNIPDKDETDYHYVGKYVGNRIFDSVIQIYLMSLGEFDFDGYKEGPDVVLAWVMFLLGTFICCVVFLNMLIAIMGGTYATVEETQE